MSELDRIAVIVDDITRLEVDAIVNAANAELEAGGGVDGAIHDAAGPQLRTACRLIGGCEPGDAVATPGFQLPARHVIHAVGPVWKGGSANERMVLASCYRRALTVSRELGCTSIAFPCISTGVYGYPKHDAALVAIDAVRDDMRAHDTPREIIFCCHRQEDGEIYRAGLRAGRDK